MIVIVGNCGISVLLVMFVGDLFDLMNLFGECGVF